MGALSTSPSSRATSQMLLMSAPVSSKALGADDCGANMVASATMLD